MKKARLLWLFVLIVAAALLFAGCKQRDREVSSIALKDHDPTGAIEMPVGVFDYGAYTVVVTYASGETEEIALTEEMIKQEDLFLLYQVGEHDITVSYGAQTYTFKVSVKRSTFEGLTLPESPVFTYNGKAHTVEVDGDIPANATVTYPGGNSFINAGTYDVAAIVSCEGYVTEKLFTTVKIERATYDMSGVRFEGKEVVYDGNVHALKITGTLPAGVLAPTYTINEKATSSATDVGEYKVVASFANSDPNYEPIPNMEATLKITQAEYNVKDVDIVFKNEGGGVIGTPAKMYDGKSVTFDLNDYDKLSKKISVSFSVLDKDGTVISNSNKSTNIINAGVYTVKVEFLLSDGKNYKPIAPLVRSFEVLKAAPPSIGDILFEPVGATYDGTPHSILIEGELPEGITVSYEYYLNGELVVDGAGVPVRSVVNAGRYTVKAVFEHNDPNREPIPSASVMLNIERIKVDATALLASLQRTVAYSGVPYLPNILTWQQVNGTDYDILQYGTTRFYAVRGDSLVEMGERECPTEVGLYQMVLLLSIAADYEQNYCFADGNSSWAIIENIEIQKKRVSFPTLTFESETETVYTGNAQEVKVSYQADEQNPVTVRTAYFKYGANGYTAMAAGTYPIDAGVYRFVVTLTLTDASNSVFENGEASVEYAFEFEIKKKVISIDELFGQTPQYTYTGNDLRQKTFDDLSPEIKQYLHAEVIATYSYDGYSWYDTPSVSECGYYRVQYYVTVKDRNNIALLQYGVESTLAYVYHSFYIV